MKTIFHTFFLYSMYMISIGTTVLGFATIFVPIQHSTAIGLMLMSIGVITFLKIKKVLG